MSVKQDTRAQILTRAERLFQERGFNGFSYHDIAQSLNIKNAAIHYYFPSKTDLGVALIARYREILRVSTQDFMLHGNDPLRQLEGYLAFINNRCSNSDMTCPIGMLASDFNTLPAAMQEGAAELAHETLQWMSSVFERGREQGVFEFEGHAADMATTVLSTLQGAEQLGSLHVGNALGIAVAQIKLRLNISQ